MKKKYPENVPQRDRIKLGGRALGLSGSGLRMQCDGYLNCCNSYVRTSIQKLSLMLLSKQRTDSFQAGPIYFVEI